jgi:hypothetical protein
LLALVAFTHSRQSPDKNAALGNRFDDGLGAIHVSESVQNFLGTVGKIALRSFEIPKCDRRLRGAHHNR